MSPIGALVEALASGAIEIVDLTQLLNERTPVIRLPEQFVDTPGLKPARDQPLRRARPRLGLVLARDRRARRHSL